MEYAKEDMERATLEYVDKTCKDIAQARRMYEIQGGDLEKFDEHLNESCTKWAEHYAGMSAIKLALEGIMEIAAAGHGEELMKDLMEKIGDK